MYTASDLRKGLRLKMDNEPYIIVEFNFVKPGKGQALYRCKLKNMITGSQFERSFRSVDTFEPADLREKKMQYLYKEGNKYCFMDNENYEQVELTKEQLGNAVNFLKENMDVKIMVYEGRILGIDLPNTVELRVVETDPGIRGDTATGGSKPAKLDTGYVVKVPLFINEGDVLRIDTRTGDYIERA